MNCKQFENEFIVFVHFRWKSSYSRKRGIFCYEKSVFILLYCVPLCLYALDLVLSVCACVPDAHFYIGQLVTQSVDITSATIRQDHASTKQMQKATAAKTVPTVPLHMDHMTCAVLCMISGTKRNELYNVNHIIISVCFYAAVAHGFVHCGFCREVQVMESQGGTGVTEGGGGDGQSGQAASTALIEKILSEEPRWQGK